MSGGKDVWWNEEANTVHHIYPADEYPQYAWCDWNLISVSTERSQQIGEPADRRADRAWKDVAGAYNSRRGLEKDETSATNPPR